MTWTLQASGTTSGNSSTPSFTPTNHQTAGRLLVFDINHNDNGATSIDAGGVAWTESVNAVPSGPTETCRRVTAYKETGGSEPASYSLTSASSAEWRINWYVFSTDQGGFSLDASNVAASGNVNHMTMTAINGQSIVDGDLVFLFGLKDLRGGFNAPFTTADNSFTGVVGNMEDQAAVGAYRIYTANETASYDVESQSSIALSDACHSVFLRFSEGAGGGGFQAAWANNSNQVIQ